MAYHVTYREPQKTTTITESIGAFLRSRLYGPFSLKDAETAKRFRGGSSSASGMPVNPWTAMNYAAFWQGVTLIAGHMGAFPLILYKRTNTNGRQGKTRYYDSRVYRLLHDEWNPEMSSMAARETMQAHALSWGNGYSEIERDVLDRPVAFWLITPDRVTPVRSEVLDPRTGRTVLGPIRYKVTNPGGPDSYIEAKNMIHIPGPGFDGTTGYSVIEKARETIGLGLAAERAGATFHGNGLSFGGILSTDGDMDEEELKDARTNIEAMHQGPDRAHRFLILKNGLKYQPIAVKPADAQYLESRKFQIEEIARWLNLPPHKLKHLERSTNNNIEHQGIEYFQDTLYPWTVRWEQELNRKVIPPLERRQQFIEHLVDGVLRGDISTRYKAYAVGRQWGWLSADDVRAMENMDPLAVGGDVYLVPANMTPADRLDDVIDAQIVKNEQPALPPGEDPAADPDEPPPDDDEADKLDDRGKGRALVAAWERIRVQRRALHDAGVRYQAAREALASATDTASGIEADRDAARTELAAAESRATQAAADLVAQGSELAAAVARVAALEGAITEHTARAEALTRDLEQAARDLEAARSLCELEAQTRATWEARAMEAEASAEQLAGQLTTHRLEAAEREAALEAERAQAAEAMQQRIDQAEAARAAAAAELVTIGQQLAGAKEQEAEALAARAAAEQRAGEQAAALEQLEATHAAAVADRDAARARVAELTEIAASTAARTDQAADQARAEIAELSEQLRNARATADSLSTAAEAAGAELEQLRATFAAEQAATAATLQQLQAEGEALARRGEDLAADHAALEVRIAELTAAGAAAEAEAAELLRLAEERAAAQALEATASAARAIELSARVAELEAAQAEAVARAEDTARQAAAIAQLEADLASVRAELTERQTTAAETEDALGVLRAEAEAAALERAALVADQVAAVERHRAEHLAVLEQLRTEHAGALEQLRAAAALELREQRQSEVDRLAASINAHRGIFVDAMARMVHREVERARTRGRTPARLEAWIREFYPQHEETMIEALLPAVRVHLAWSGSGEDAAVVTRRHVREHCAESVRLFKSLAGEDPDQLVELLERAIGSWETHRPAAFAERLLQEEIDYVRSYRV